MKQQLIVAAIIAAMHASISHATTTDLFISEYIEGSSNNKALELANLSGQPIDLADYQLAFYFNGKTTVGLALQPTGILASGEVYVLAHTSADPAILAVADFTQGGGWFNGNDAIVLSAGGVVVDSIGQIGFDPESEWGDGLNSTKDNSLRRTLNDTPQDNNPHDEFYPATQWQGFANNTFTDLGKLEDLGEPVDMSCGDPATAISEIQGVASNSLLIGHSLEVEAIVVGDFQNADQLNGFFLQQADNQQDNNPQTSEGIFVYEPQLITEVNIGDRVRVAAQVNEYSGMTQLNNVTNMQVCDSNQRVTPVSLSLPFASIEAAEAFEGMSVVFEQPLTVSENYNLGRYGELVLSSGRLINPTNLVQPGVAAQELQQANERNRIILDDASTRQNPAHIIHPQPALSAFNTVRGGDQVHGLSGVLSQAFGAYRVQPVSSVDFQAVNQRDSLAERQSNELRVASFNLLNYFNGDGLGGGYPTARGASSAEEFARQRNKIISALVQLDADVIGLMEIENDGFEPTSAIADLLQGLNHASGKQYTFVRPESALIGSDAITVGLIYDTATVAAIGTTATLNSDAFANKNRQPVAQSFRELASNGEFTVAVNHFKSKGSCPDDQLSRDADQNDGQGCWNGLRTEAAQQLISWLHSSPTGIDEQDVLVIGDLNAYAMEDPVTTIESLGMTNLLKKYQGTQHYSYVFMGQAGTLDHALATSHLTQQVSNVSEWHINADEPKVLDYNLEYKTLEQQTGLYSQQAYRASDHDPVVVTMQLRPEIDINNDGKLNVKDIIAVAARIQKNVSGNNRRYDLNADGKIDHLDLRQVIRAVIRFRRSR